MRNVAIWFALRYLRFWARIALLIHRPVVIGIAGSVGKTSTKYALATILKKTGRTINTSGNSETGVPLGVLGIALRGYSLIDWTIAFFLCPFRIFNLAGADFLIAEMGIDGPMPPKNMGYLLTIVQPDTAVIVAESAAHTMQFEKALSAEEKNLPDEERGKKLIARIAEEDAKMASTVRCREVVYSADNPFVVQAVGNTAPSSVRRTVFGTVKNSSLMLSGYDVSLEGTSFSFDESSKKHSLSVKGYALPREYGEVFAAALLAARASGVTIAEGLRSLEQGFGLPKSRATLLKGVSGSVIIDSSYNASPASVRAFLDLSSELKRSTGRAVVFAFGDMRELGTAAPHEHRELVKRLPGAVDYLYCMGPLTKEHVVPAAERMGLREVRWFGTAQDLGAYLSEHMPQHALVLVKGSQNEIFLEEAIKPILADPKDAIKLCRQEAYWRKGS